MHPSDFTSPYPGRLISTIDGGKAFVPNPLPPQLELNWSLVADLSDADRALSELAGTARKLANPHLLIRPFVRREAVLSSRIEGTQSNASDVLIYESGQTALLPSESSRSDAQEVANYIHALDYGVERMQTLPVSLRLIRELHEKLMTGVRGKDKMPGEFRRDQNWIGQPGASIQDATYVPPPPQEMNAGLEALETFLHAHSELPPLVRMALAHYQFEAIHPFLDGNGRIGRLLIPLLLIQQKLLPQPLLYLSAYFEKTRETYYSHLLAVSQRSQWAQWIQYFLRGVAEQSRDAVVRSRKLIDLQRVYRERLETGRGSALLLRLVDSLFADPILSTSDAAKRVDVTRAAASHHIAKLVQANILQKYGPTMYGQLYQAKEIIDLSETNRLADLLPDFFHDVP